MREPWQGHLRAYQGASGTHPVPTRTPYDSGMAVIVAWERSHVPAHADACPAGSSPLASTRALPSSPAQDLVCRDQSAYPRSVSRLQRDDLSPDSWTRQQAQDRSGRLLARLRRSSLLWSLLPQGRRREEHPISCGCWGRWFLRIGGCERPSVVPVSPSAHPDLSARGVPHTARLPHGTCTGQS